ncbi:SAM-dependent methyltransferase [Campylobacterota bacterium]|nr:SAM-dependent methyltransferase [Campylobacterota bacterium]
MRFSDYAHDWLYGENGYYAKTPPIGKRGDFYTSVSASPFFGGAIANHIVRQIAAGELDEDALICEFGAHGGELTADVAQFIHTIAPKLFASLRFAIVEPIAALRERQERYLQEGFGNAIALAIVPKIDDLSAKSSFVFANELFDSFAFDIIDRGKIAFVENGAIVWREEAGLEASFRGERFLGYESFAKRLRSRFERCEFMTFDYGTKEARGDFSARIYKDHQVFALFELPTLAPFFQNSDLTADVNFGALIEAFRGAGFETATLKNQNSALIEMGIAELLKLYEEKAGFEAYRREVGRVRTLLDPATLGERFKMLLVR